MAVVRQVCPGLQVAAMRGWFSIFNQELSTRSLSTFIPGKALSGVLGEPTMNTTSSGGMALGIRAYHNLLATLDLPTRRGHFDEVPVVSEMLPNRKFMAAQFSPHGISLVPKSIIVPLPSASLAPAPPPPVVEEPEDPVKNAPMQAISNKTWRRLKMKKHKIAKRRKATRMKTK